MKPSNHSDFDQGKVLNPAEQIVLIDERSYKITPSAFVRRGFLYTIINKNLIEIRKQRRI
jgi:hypothetical protein